MKYTAALFAALSLAACGGGSSGGTVTPPTTSPTAYTVQLHWQPASTVGLSSFLRPEARQPYAVTFGNTIVVGSGNGGGSAYDPTNIPAYVSVSVSPEPSPGATATFSTTSTAVNVQPTPVPATPNPSASPAIVLAAAAPNTKDSGHTVSATIAGATGTDNLVVYPTLSLVAPKSGSPTLPDAIGFSFDSSCQAQPQSMTAAADVYLTYDTASTVTYPNGGVVLAWGADVTTLTAANWSNAGTSTTLDALGNVVPADDTLIFKTSTGRVVFLSMREYGGDGPSASNASIIAIYGCLN